MKRRASKKVLQQHLRYDPETGWLWWKIPGMHRTLSKPAGGINGKGYRDIKFKGVNYRGNRLAWLFMKGVWPKRQVDHKDTVKSNDRWSNLRLATGGQNKHNAARQSNNKSGYKGVHWHKHKKQWAVTCKKDGRIFNLGYFNDPEVAYNAYVAKAKEQFGEFFHGG